MKVCNFLQEIIVTAQRKTQRTEKVYWTKSGNFPSKTSLKACDALSFCFRQVEENNLDRHSLKSPNLQLKKHQFQKIKE
jgi:hypothetical protein